VKPRKKVVSAVLQEDRDKEMFWRIRLECGHHADVKAKPVKGQAGKFRDPPVSAACSECWTEFSEHPKLFG
jgi:hypothetical protein